MDKRVDRSWLPESPDDRDSSNPNSGAELWVAGRQAEMIWYPTNTPPVTQRQVSQSPSGPMAK